MSSVKEDNRSGEVDGSEKADGAFVVASGEGAVLLEFGEEVFNQMAGLIEVRIIRTRLEPIGLGGNDRRHLRLRQEGQDALLGVIGFIGEQRGNVFQQRGQEGRYSGQVGGVAGREMKAGRIAQGITGRMEFRAQAPTRAPDAFDAGVPPFAPAPCWWTRIIVASIMAYSLSASVARC